MLTLSSHQESERTRNAQDRQYVTSIISALIRTVIVIGSVVSSRYRRAVIESISAVQMGMLLRLLTMWKGTQTRTQTT